MSSTVNPAYAPTYRLTRRGRVVVFALGFLVLLAIGLVFAAASMATGEPEATETIVVAPGQTLWEIASGVAAAQGTDDVRETMTHLVELNDLDSVALGAGQSLEVPVD